MSRVRPTIKVLKALPRESFRDPTAHDIANSADDTRVVEDLRLHGLQHALLEDAERQLEQGSLSSHQSSSKAAGQKVYEARDHGGAGWRGAFVREGADWWLVHVERHDEFNQRAAKVLTNARRSDWAPSDLDYEVLDAEQADRALEQWRTGVLRALVDAICAAAAADGVRAARSFTEKPDLPDQEISGSPIGELAVTVMHDTVADIDPMTAHEISSFLEIELSLFGVSGARAAQVRDEVLTTCIPYLGVAQEELSSIYGRNGNLKVSLMVSQAKLIQLAQDPDFIGAQALTPAVPSKLHYAKKDALTAGYITGSTVRAVCGFTFVPTKDEYSADGLPICHECEAGSPSAEILSTWDEK